MAKKVSYRKYRKVIGDVPAHARMTKKEFKMFTSPLYTARGTATGRGLRAAGIKRREMRTDLEKALRKSVLRKRRKK